jgi:ribonuclease R
MRVPPKNTKGKSPLSFSPADILSSFQTPGKTALTLAEIAQALGVPADQRRDLRRGLRDLIDERRIIKFDRRHYGLPSKEKAIVGRMQAHRGGYGFLIPEDSAFPDIFLNRRESRDLMHRDRIVLHLGKKEKGRKHGPRVLEILERANRRIVGRYAPGPKYDSVIPEEERLVQNIRIPKKSSGGARENQIVLAEITRYPTHQEGPEGRVVKILGNPGDPHIDSEIIIHKYDLPDAFPPEALQEASAVPQKTTVREGANRQDLRTINFFTIDGETARDFDDAVAIAPTARGGFRLWVAIADVSHYVKERSSLDREAFQRGTSVYFPERAIPMLPLALSNGICSLNPDEDRLIMAAAMEFDGQGRIMGTEFFPGIIHSRARLTYTMVKEMIQEKKRELISRFPHIYHDLQTMADLCLKLRSRRMERGSIDFDLPEPQVILDVQGQIEEIVKADRHIGHQMIEEFMIATNEAVARFLNQDENPCLYRIHEPPEKKKIEEFKEFITHLGYRLDVKGKLNPKLFQRLLAKVRGKPEEKAIHTVLLRSMKQAQYSEKNLGHFALASAHYLHFTSPIRRFPDLVVHRVLKEVLTAGQLSANRRQRWINKLPEIAEHSSQRERIAMEAEREIVDRKKVQFMRDKVGQEFNGYISGVLPFGIFVELEDFFIEGLVHLTCLPEDRYQFLEARHTLVGERRKKTFRLGDRVRIRVEAANLERRRIDFSLLQ